MNGLIVMDSSWDIFGGCTYIYDGEIKDQAWL
jgi:hypothetical protein